MQFTTAFAALEVFTEHSAATKSPAESFEAELRSAVHFAAEPFSVIFDALEASTLQETASTEALIFDALDASSEQLSASIEASTVERRQRFDRLQRKTHRQRIERLVGPLLGRLPDFAGKVERRQHPQTLNSETTRQP